MNFCPLIKQLPIPKYQEKEAQTECSHAAAEAEEGVQGSLREACSLARTECKITGEGGSNPHVHR